MKRFTLLIVLGFLSGFGHAQEPLFVNNQPNEAVGQDPRQDAMNFIPGEVLVKFKDDIAITPDGRLKPAGVSSVDRVLSDYGINSIEKLFTGQQRLKSVVIMKDPLGRDLKIPSLHNIYRIKLTPAKTPGNNPGDFFTLLEELKTLQEVEYAEPNYVFCIGEFNPTGPVLVSQQAVVKTDNIPTGAMRSGLIPNDPLFASQWGIPATNIDDVWNTETGDSTAVIAILDTGVDWLHPDLAANIWVNSDDLPGNGIDDDGNGKIDDIRGWDYINNDNNPADDNSHGTHCAGIAAAVGNNNIGIAGANWKARIMPVKVFQSSGYGDAATIAQGVTYAANNGATVLSMSFGAYAESLTMKSALASAYATAVLVAAGGNDGLCIGPGFCPDGRLSAPLYPGAYSFVLGVEATQQTTGSCGLRACFSNFDQDGPVFSAYYELLNYELKAPGSEILSCIPGGNYRVYSGTSMATPLIAGAVSLYRTLRPEESTELLFGNLINSLGDHLDLDGALNVVPTPVLNMVTCKIADTLDGDGDGRADAGETIEFKVLVRNTWGQANNVKVGIAFHEFEDTTTATILTREAAVGSISAYATLFNAIPLKVQFANGLTDGRDIVFDLTTWYDDHQGEETRQIVISVENGVELGGTISDDLTLYPDQHYIVTENIVILQGVTLTIKPGTTLKFAEGKSMMVAGKVKALGTKDSLITFTKRDLGGKWKSLETTYSASFDASFSVFEEAGYPSQYLFKFDGNVNIVNSCFKNNIGGGGILLTYHATIQKSCFYSNRSGSIECYSEEDTLYNNNIIQNSNDGGAIFSGGILLNLQRNNIFSHWNTNLNKEINIFSWTSGFSIVKLDSNYYGTTNEEKINSGIYDFPESGHGIWIDISKKLNRPLREAHGIVWKVEVNGKDAQDEFDLLDPMGIGQQMFKVWFNRPMDIEFPPAVSMGVRYPYTQTAIAENGSWSADSTSYTVYGTVGLLTGDGINNLRVIGARDTDHFEIPTEDRRFRVIVNGAGSLSAGFMATPGMNKVTLQWENPQEGVSDLLGYNMYRFTYLNDTVTSDTIMINPVLITDTVFTDFDVEPGSPYFYAYRTVRTNLSESDFSQLVTATPYTAALGDANGDLTVNVLDITTMIAYMINQNPSSFIFTAADVNNDNIINVLDVIGVVNIICGKKKDVIAENPPAYVYLDDGTISFKTTHPVAGLQFELEGKDLDNIQLQSKFPGYELVSCVSNGKLLGILFSYDNKPLPLGLQTIVGISGETDQLRWGELVAGDLQGNPVKVIPDELHVYSLEDGILNVYPNPFTQSTNIQYELFEQAHVEIAVHDLYGRMVSTVFSGSLPKGEFTKTWNGDGVNGRISTSGVYLIRFNATGQSGKTVKKYAKVVMIN